MAIFSNYSALEFNVHLEKNMLLSMYIVKESDLSV